MALCLAVTQCHPTSPFSKIVAQYVFHPNSYLLPSYISRMSVFAPLSLCCRRLHLHLLFFKWGTSAGFINTTFADSQGLFQQIFLWDWPHTLHGFLCNTQSLRLSYKRHFEGQAWPLDPTDALASIMQLQAIKSYSCCAGALQIPKYGPEVSVGPTWSYLKSPETNEHNSIIRLVFFSSAFCILPKSCSLISSGLTQDVFMVGWGQPQAGMREREITEQTAGIRGGLIRFGLWAQVPTNKWQRLQAEVAVFTLNREPGEGQTGHEESKTEVSLTLLRR